MNPEKTWLDYCGPNWYGEQDENGIDLSLIRENLKLTPLERMIKAEAAEHDTRLLLDYGRRHREKQVRQNRSDSHQTRR